MSCNYADGLSAYENKGVLGIPEVNREYFFPIRIQYNINERLHLTQVFDDESVVNEKCATLAQWILSAKHVVVHTGAGISTSAGIPDFR